MFCDMSKIDGEGRRTAPRSEKSANAPVLSLERTTLMPGFLNENTGGTAKRGS